MSETGRESVDERGSLLSTKSMHPEPDTATKIVKRIRALVIKLLPVQVEIDQISDATSSIITPKVIEAFAKAGGDFAEAVPFCLLRARALFIREGYHNPPDYDECRCRAVACEVLARRIVHILPKDRLESVMSGRHRYRESDGDISAPVSCLEMAIDQHCTIFLSSSESQHVVNSLWRGDWVQRNNENNDIDYEKYEKVESGYFWDHINPQRLGVPRYQTLFRQITWLVYLFVYSRTVQSPLESLDPEHVFDEWEIVLYTMTLAYLIEELYKLFKVIRITPRLFATINFWTIINFLTDGLLVSAFVLRVIGLTLDQEKDDQAQYLQFKSFQVLSCVAPLIWIKLLTVFDGFKVVGTLQVVVFRMLRESAIFFILLAIMAIGFLQSLYALDAADGEAGGTGIVINGLIQALLGSPDFDTPSSRFGYPFGLIVYYSWNFLATIILVNVLIALFGSAYSDVEENATDEYLAFFANKTIDLIRAPDSYVYPAPFNLLEAFFIAPLEWILPSTWYVKLNRIILSTIFAIPLIIIALFESQISHPASRKRLQLLFGDTGGSAREEEDDPKVLDPDGGEDDEGEISRVSYKELVSEFPNTTITESAVIEHEMRIMQKKLDEMERLLKSLAGKESRERDEGKT
ncbi:calcium activated cation channel [Kockovaella imperatae]|uniref:Calcium activated cation channel n=1 Tax=Kockovaella imperatae TaxID=4999 RepID=A0A1Y1U6N1_9TREE|nr:calcium activated cation channel [Kockovaella imperatae]ORX33691.1 calcium activated cation channel [Kockovaella imperatae]